MGIIGKIYDHSIRWIQVILSIVIISLIIIMNVSASVFPYEQY